MRLKKLTGCWLSAIPERHSVHSGYLSTSGNERLEHRSVTAGVPDYRAYTVFNVPAKLH